MLSLNKQNDNIGVRIFQVNDFKQQLHFVVLGKYDTFSAFEKAMSVETFKTQPQPPTSWFS